jgi:hypothetical protein
MHFKKIVGFGDSWVWGDELLDPALDQYPNIHPVVNENTPYREKNCFLGLLGQHYNVPVENYGWPGGSNQSSLWCYLWWIQQEQVPADCLILVAHPDPWRTSFYNPNHVGYSGDPPWNKFMHLSWLVSDIPTISHEWKTLGKLYSVLSDCVQLRDLTYQQSVMFFEGQNYINKNILQFNIMKSYKSIPSSNLIWPESSLMALLDKKTNVLASGGHPNENGHKIIRDHLIIEIDRAII